MGFDQVDDPVEQDEPHADVRVGGEKFVNDWCDVQLAEHDRRGNRKLSPRRAILAGHCALRIVQFVEDAPGGRDIGRPLFGQLQSAAGPDQQLCSKPADRLPPSTAANNVRIASNRSIQPSIFRK
jgi:hypothetical protein